MMTPPPVDEDLSATSPLFQSLAITWRAHDAAELARAILETHPEAVDIYTTFRTARTSRGSSRMVSTQAWPVRHR